MIINQIKIQIPLWIEFLSASLRTIFINVYWRGRTWQKLRLYQKPTRKKTQWKNKVWKKNVSLSKVTWTHDVLYRCFKLANKVLYSLVILKFYHLHGSYCYNNNCYKLFNNYIIVRWLPNWLAYQNHYLAKQAWTWMDIFSTIKIIHSRN